MAIKFLSTLNLSDVTAGSILKVDSNGNIVAATAGTDYVTSNLWTTTSSDIYRNSSVRIGTYQTSIAPDARLHVFDYQTTTPKLLIEDGNTGDASMQFKISTQQYTMGIDNSDSDKFVLAASSALGTTNVLEISTTGVAQFGNDIKLNNGWTLTTYSTNYAKFGSWVNVEDTGLFTFSNLFMDLDDSSSRFVIRGTSNVEQFIADTATSKVSIPNWSFEAPDITQTASGDNWYNTANVEYNQTGIKLNRANSGYVSAAPYKLIGSFTASVSFKTSNCTHLGIIFAALESQPDNNNYGVIIRNTASLSEVRVQKRVGGSQSYPISAVTVTPDCDDGNWHELTVSYNKKHIVVDIDGVNYINQAWTDTSFTDDGYVGLAIYDNTCQFNDFQVTETPSTTTFEKLHLTSTEPQLLIKNPVSGTGNAVLKFEEGSGSTQNATITYNQGGQNNLTIATGYQSASDENLIQLAPAGNIGLTVRGGTGNNNGNVGIGETSPTSKLEVRGATATHQLVSINRANSSTAALYLGNNSSNDAIISGNNAPISLGKDVSGTYTEYVNIATDGELKFSAYGAGILKTNASGIVSVDTSTYVTDVDWSDIGSINGTINVNSTTQIGQGDTETLVSFQNSGTERGSFQVDDSANSYFVATGFKTATASTGFLKANGTVDTSTYLTSVAFSDITSKPTTLSGYGITDGATVDYVDTEVSGLASESWANTNLVNVTGDTMTGDLTIKRGHGDLTFLTLKQEDTSGDLVAQKSFIDFTFVDSNTNETPQVRIGAEVGNNDGSASSLGEEGMGAFVVYTNNADTDAGAAGTSLAERLRVDRLGRVGIGSSNPAHPLHVVGDIYTTSDFRGNSIISTNAALSIDNTGIQPAQGEVEDIVAFKFSTTKVAHVDTDGYISAAGFKTNTASTGFLKANGTVDTSTYLTSYTETDTLNSVTGRGATTTNNISVGNLTAVGGTFTDPVTIYDSTTTENPRLSVGRNAGESIQFGVTDVVNTITAKQDSDSDGDHTFVLDRVFAGAGDSIFSIHNDGTPDLTIDGSGVVSFNQYNTAGILKVNTSGAISVDTSSYLTSYTETSTLDNVADRGATTNQALTLGSSATSGGRILSANYTGSNRLGVISSEYSSGDLLLGYGAEGKNGSAGFVSTYGNFSGAHSVLQIASSSIDWRVDTSNSQTEIGGELTLESQFAVSRTGILTMGDGFTSTKGNTAYGWGDHSSEGYLTSYTETDTLSSVVSRGASTTTAITTGGITATYGHFGGTSTAPQVRIYTENASASIADTFADTSTDKSYIYFMAGTNSNDPGYIMHETSESASPDERNEGVLHLVPSDDNSTGDYVSIHGTNDADVLKLHTSGLIETATGYQLVLKSGNASVKVDDTLHVTGRLYVDTLDANTSSTSALVEGTSGEIEKRTLGSAAFSTATDFVAVGGDTVTGQITFPTAIGNRPVFGEGIIARSDQSDTDGTHDIWGISERYYPSNSTAADAWGIQWSGTPNEINFIGAGQKKLSIDLDTAGTVKIDGNAVATESYVTTQISNLVDSAPAALDTLNELAAALGDDANFSTTMSTALGNRLRIDVNNQSLSSTELSNARTNLGLGTAATSAATDFVAVSGDTMTGNLTMSSATPTLKFSINGAENNAGIVWEDGDAGDPSAQAAAIKWDASSNHMRFYNNDEAAERMRINSDGTTTFLGTINASAGIGGLTLANGGISGTNYNITGVNQLEIADPGEGIVFKSGSSGDMTLAIVDDTADNILRFSGTNAVFDVAGDLSSTNLTIADSIIHEGDADTKISFTTDVININTGGGVRASISNSTSKFNNDVVIIGGETLSLGERAEGDDLGRTVLIEGVANAANGEGSGRIFFTEHNSTTAAADSYGLSLYYEGDPNAQLPSGFQPNTGNATWSLRRHDNSVNGVAIMSGTRSSSDVTFSGSISATSKSFDIEHPTKEGKRLVYGSLEGAEHGVYFRGKGTGEVIELPDHWTGLVHEDSITVQLTPIGKNCVWVEDIKDNAIHVGMDNDTPYFYFIQGERKDIDKLIVEQDA